MPNPTVTRCLKVLGLSTVFFATTALAAGGKNLACTEPKALPSDSSYSFLLDIDGETILRGQRLNTSTFGRAGPDGEFGTPDDAVRSVQLSPEILVAFPGGAFVETFTGPQTKQLEIVRFGSDKEPFTADDTRTTLNREQFWSPAQETDSTDHRLMVWIERENMNGGARALRGCDPRLSSGPGACTPDTLFSVQLSPDQYEFSSVNTLVLGKGAKTGYLAFTPGEPGKLRFLNLRTGRETVVSGSLDRVVANRGDRLFFSPDADPHMQQTRVSYKARQKKGATEDRIRVAPGKAVTRDSRRKSWKWSEISAFPLEAPKYNPSLPALFTAEVAPGLQRWFFINLKNGKLAALDGLGNNDPYATDGRSVLLYGSNGTRYVSSCGK